MLCASRSTDYFGTMDHHPLPPVVPGAITLLIVDNGDVVRRSTARMLSEEGYVHGAEIMSQDGLSDLNAPFLAKPFTRRELLGKVHEALTRDVGRPTNYPFR